MAKTLTLDRRQTRLLMSPARLEILEAFGALQRASARELAAHLGRPPGAVYHHLRTLAQAGLLVEADVRHTSRRPETVYAPAASRLAVAAGVSKSGDRQAIETLEVLLRQAGRDVARALARDPAALKGRFHGVQLSSALTRSEVKRLMALFEEIEALLRRANRRRPARGRAVYRWTSVFVPLHRTRL